MEKKEFIVGEWYKGREKGDYYMKYKSIHISNPYNTLYCSDGISSGLYCPNQTTWANSDFEKFVLEYGPVSREEISPYLPDGHPDKVLPEQLLINIL